MTLPEYEEYIKKLLKIEPFDELNSADWEKLSQNYYLRDDFILKYSDRLDWYRLTQKSLSEDVIRQNIDKIDAEGRYGGWRFSAWQNISRYQNLSLDFINEFWNRLDTYCLSENDYIKDRYRNIRENPEWLELYFKIKKSFRKFPFYQVKSSLQSSVFWQEYIVFLKEKYNDPAIVKIKIAQTMENSINFLKIKESKIDKILKSIITEPKIKEFKKKDS